MPSKPKPFLNEHRIARWLRKAGYNRESLVKELEIPRNQLGKALTKPAKYLTIRRLMLISGMVQRPFAEVFFAALSHPNLKREMEKDWQNETGIQLKEITEPED